MSTPKFALPGFMPHESPNADALVMANQDGSWRFETGFASSALVIRIERVDQASKVGTVIIIPATEQMLDRSGNLLVVTCRPDIMPFIALKGDTRVRVTLNDGKQIERTIRQTVDVSAAPPE